MKKISIICAVFGLLVLASQPAAAQDVEKQLKTGLDLYKQGKYDDAIKEISVAMMVMHNKRKLEVTNMFLCTEVTGFGEYKRKESNTFKKGDPFILYWELEGYGVNQEKDRFWFSVSQDVKIVDTNGKEMVKKDNFLDYKKYFNVPIFPFFMQNRINTGKFDAGKYKYQFVIKDNVKKSFINKEFEFEIVEK